MIIEISYESKYSLGTTRNGEYFLHSMKDLVNNENKEIKNEIEADDNYLDGYFKNLKIIEKIYPNIMYTDITEDTVLGVLSRLVGDVRRLDDIKKDNSHPIMKIKDKVNFEVQKEYFQNELITLHTIPKPSQNGAGGIIKNITPIVNNNPFSELLLSVFNYKTPQEIMGFINMIKQNDKIILNNKYLSKISLNTIIRELFLSEKNLKNDPTFNAQLNTFYNTKVYNIHGVLMYEMLRFLKKNNLYEKEISQLLTKNGNIPGIASQSGGLTVKDFLGFHVGSKKEGWLLPYSINIKYDHVKKQTDKKINSNANIGVTKEGGKLIISLEISQEEAIEINNMIEEARVNTFYLGKKGIAYITKIKGI